MTLPAFLDDLAALVGERAGASRRLNRMRTAATTIAFAHFIAETPLVDF